MIKSLKEKYNLHPNKTKDAEIRFSIPKEYIGDFVRGFFDGDGWVCNRRNSVEFGICTASKNFIYDFQKLCGGIGRIRERISNKRIGATMSLYVMDAFKSESMIFRKLIYNNEPFCLKRKKEKFWNFYTPSEKLWTREQERILKDNILKSVSELAKILDKSEKSIQMKKFKMGLCPKKPKNWKWTKEEERKIMEIKDIDILVKEIDRPRRVIIIRKNKLIPSENLNLWKEDEEEFLIKNHNMPRKWLSEKLNKKEMSIKQKLGLLRRKNKIPKAKIGRIKRV